MKSGARRDGGPQRPGLLLAAWCLLWCGAARGQSEPSTIVIRLDFRGAKPPRAPSASVLFDDGTANRFLCLDDGTDVEDRAALDRLYICRGLLTSFGHAEVWVSDGAQSAKGVLHRSEVDVKPQGILRLSVTSKDSTALPAKPEDEDTEEAEEAEDADAAEAEDGAEEEAEEAEEAQESPSPWLLEDPETTPVETPTIGEWPPLVRTASLVLALSGLVAALSLHLLSRGLRARAREFTHLLGLVSSGLPRGSRTISRLNSSASRPTDP